jgi:hypothetical protein
MKRDIAILAIFIAVFSGFIILNQNLAKPTIYIIREYEAESMQGPCKVVDYTVNGYATSAVFYDYEIEAYRDFIKQLEKEGRIVKNSLANNTNP